MSKSKIIIISVVILFAVGIYWIFYLRWAHSSFSNYYKFRGCDKLINRTFDTGDCQLKSGATIKIVKYKEKWYLDGDLPSGKFLDF